MLDLPPRRWGRRTINLLNFAPTKDVPKTAASARSLLPLVRLALLPFTAVGANHDVALAVFGLALARRGGYVDPAKRHGPRDGWRGRSVATSVSKRGAHRLEGEQDTLGSVRGGGKRGRSWRRGRRAPRDGLISHGIRTNALEVIKLHLPARSSIVRWDRNPSSGFQTIWPRDLDRWRGSWGGRGTKCTLVSQRRSLDVLLRPLARGSPHRVHRHLEQTW